MSERTKYPNKFLGRCQTCLDNAYLADEPCRFGYRNGAPLNDDECLVRRARNEYVREQHLSALSRIVRDRPMTSPAARKAAEALRQLRDAYVIYVPVAVSQRTRKLIDEALAALEAEATHEPEAWKAKQSNCDHYGWSFDKDGSRCAKCLAMMIDAGD